MYGWTKIAGNFPIPVYNGNLFIHFEQADRDVVVGSMITKNGELKIIGSTVSFTKNLYDVISYPIA